MLVLNISYLVCNNNNNNNENNNDDNKTNLYCYRKHIETITVMKF